MPYKKPVIEKIYYSISEVAEMFSLNASHIRFWENEFDSVKPKRNAKGNRLFTNKDIDELRLIYYFVKEKGLTLDGAKKKLKENREEAILRMQRALEELTIGGIATTIPFHQEILKDEIFKKGDFHTGFLNTFKYKKH